MLMSVGNSDTESTHFRGYYFSLYSIGMLTFLSWVGCQCYALAVVLAIFVVPYMHHVLCPLASEALQIDRSQRTDPEALTSTHRPFVSVERCLAVMFVCDFFCRCPLLIGVYSFLLELATPSIDQQLEYATGGTGIGLSVLSISLISIISVPYSLLTCAWRIRNSGEIVVH